MLSVFRVRFTAIYLFCEAPRRWRLPIVIRMVNLLFRCHLASFGFREGSYKVLVVVRAQPPTNGIAKRFGARRRCIAFRHQIRALLPLSLGLRDFHGPGPSERFWGT